VPPCKRYKTASKDNDSVGKQAEMELEGAVRRLTAYLQEVH